MTHAAALHRQTMQHLNERQRRIYAGSIAKEYGYGGMAHVHRETGLDVHTIARGMQELTQAPLTGRIRLPGGGRKKLETHQPGLVEAVECAANPKTNHKVIVKSTSHALDHIVRAVHTRGFRIARMAVSRILHEQGYALKANKKDLEGGKDHPDRDAQFQHINMMGLKMQLQGFPILSIDAKKTEKIGNMKNGGREWTAPGDSTKVDVYDFGQKDPAAKQNPRNKHRIMKAIPYGVYDVLKKQGFVNVGIDHNTAEFAVASLTNWWETRGIRDYPEATEILLFCDGGGSNGAKNKLWKYCLQQFANQTNLTVHVCHYPPGTSKWNAIEHEMFSFININWRAKPLAAYEVILEYIKHTTTKGGLKIEAVLDTNDYETGRKITKEQMMRIHMQGDAFHPEWNYTIRPEARA